VDASTVAARLIGALIVEKGVITEEQLEIALQEQEASGRRLGEILVDQFGVTREDLASALDQQRAENESLGAEEDSEANRAVAELARLLDEWGHGEQENGQAPEPEPEPEEEAPRRPIGEIFVERGFISSHQLSEALEEQKLSGRKLGEILVAKGNLSRIRLWDALEDQLTAEPSDAPPDAAPEQRVDLQQNPTGPLPELRLASDIELPAPPPRPLRPAEWTPPPPQDSLRWLEERVERLEQAEADASTDDAVVLELRGQVAALAARLEDVSEPAEDWHDAVSALSARIDEAAARSAESLAAVERLAEQLGGAHEDGDDRDDLIADLAARVDHLAASITESVTREQAESLRTELEELRLRLDVGPESTTGPEVDALAARVTALAEGFAVQLERVTDRLADTATREDAESIRSELDHLRGAVDTAPSSAPEVEALNARIDVLANDVAALSSRAGIEDFRQELDQLRSTLETLPAPGGNVDALAERLDRVAAELSNAQRVEADSLRAELDRLRETLDTLPAPTGEVDALAERLDRIAGELSNAQRLEADSLRAELDRLRETLDTLPTPTGEVDALAARVESLRGELDEVRADLQALTGDDAVAALGELVDALAHQLAHAATRAQTDDLRHELDRLRETLETLPSSTAEVDALAARVDQIAAELRNAHREQTDGLRRELDDVRAGVDSLAHQLAHSATRAQTDDLREELGRLRESLETLPSATDDVEALHARLDRLAEELSSADREQAHTFHRELAELREAFEQLPSPTADLEALSEQVDQLTGGLAAAASRDQADRLHDQLDELRRHVEAFPRPTDEWRQAVSQLAERIDAGDETGERRAEQLATLSERVVELGADAANWRSEFDHLAREIGERVERMAGDVRNSATREETESLRHELASLRATIDAFPVPTDEWREAVAALAVQIDAAQETANEWRDAVAALAVRIDDIPPPSDEWRVELDELSSRMRDRLRQTEERVEGTATADSVAVVAMHLDDIGDQVEHTERRLDDLSVRLDELAPKWRVEELLNTAAEERHAETALLHARIDRLESALAEHPSWMEAVEPVARRLDDLEARIAEIAAVEASERAASLETLRNELAGVRGRLDDEVARLTEREQQDEAAGLAASQAIRDGLASLGERLTASEDAYLESGRTLRRSIEGLGQAIAGANGFLNYGVPGEPDTEQTSHLAFAPVADGYRLVECDGRAPSLGQVVDLEGFEDHLLRVARIGRSPLPFDERPCAFLERVSPVTD